MRNQTKRNNFTYRTNSHMYRKTPVSRTRRRKRFPGFLVFLLFIGLGVSAFLLIRNFAPNISSLINNSQAESTPSSSIPNTSEQPTIEKIPAGDSIVEKQNKNVKDLEKQELDDMLILGGQSYPYYVFSKDNAILYAKAVAASALSLDDSVQTHHIILPSAIDVLLPQEYLKDIKTSDQQKAIDFINESIRQLNTNVQSYNLFETLQSHSDEYIYFRTENAWTALGAYYGYQLFAKDKGFKSLELKDFTEEKYPGFLGRMFTNTANTALSKTPDSVDVYRSKSSISVSVTGDGGDIFDWPLISDVTENSEGLKLNAFIGGDNPYAVITNASVANNSSCVVVKDRSGNMFVPFLAEHYKTIYLVDYRYYKGSVNEIVKNNKVTEVILLSNIFSTNQSELIQDLVSVFDTSSSDIVN